MRSNTMEQSEAFLRSFRIVQRHVVTKTTAAVHPLSLEQWHTLLAIYHHEATTAKDIAALMDISASAITQQLGKLSRHGYIQQMRAIHDRRISTLVITSKGVEFITHAKKQNADFLREFLGGFGATKLHLLAGILEHAAANIINKQKNIRV